MQIAPLKELFDRVVWYEWPYLFRNQIIQAYLFLYELPFFSSVAAQK